MNLYRLAVILCMILVSNTALAQTFGISGKIVDETDTLGLPGVSITAAPAGDTANKQGTMTDENGDFVFNNLQPGKYLLKASYIGFQPYQREVTITNQDVALGSFGLSISATTLANVTVTAEAIRAQQLGDTSQFNANAYKVNPDANAEDLVTKMPGVTTEGNTLKVNGEQVQQILVDGKPFFGDDPNAAIKNLPAEVIDKIQVFDRMSDQSQFTGFDDGTASKTINIVTKPGRNNGQFGKVYAGGGIDAVSGNTNFLNGSPNIGEVNRSQGRYSAGGNVNFFKGDTRLSIIALSNNVNQQNFSSEDLVGVVGTSSGQGRGGGGTPRGGRGGDGGRGGSAGGSRGGSDAGNFLVGNQGGITQTHALGLNYSDNWGKKVAVTGSYFFNYTDNTNNTVLSRTYFPTADRALKYDESSITNTKNQNHRFNMRLEYNIDSFNSIILTPRLSFQDNDYTRQLSGTGLLNGNSIDSRTVNTNTAANMGYNFSNNLLYRHKFAKKGRTISMNFGTQINGREGDGTLYSLNEYAFSDTTLLDQQYDLQSSGYTLSGNLTYTEPISAKSQLMASYSPSFNSNNSDKETYDKDLTDNQYDILNPLLSNKFDNTYTTQRGGLNYRYNDEKLNGMLSLDGQYATLEGDRTYPIAYRLERSFNNILPRAMLNYKFAKNKNLRLMYRTNTNAPSIAQLQDVIDNTNPLILKTGNPNLRQDYSHTVIARYGATNSVTSRSFFAFVNVNMTNDYIANATYLPVTDTFIADVANGLTLNRGAQLTRPVNLDGYLAVRSFLTYGLPLKSIKSNLNLNLGGSYSKAPSMINSLVNYSNNYTLNGGFTLGSNISENLDFTLNYTGNYTTVKNSLQTTVNNSYYSQNTRFKLNWIFLKNFVFNTDINHTLYTGLDQSFNQSFLLWNAALGYKFLKDRSLDVRLSAFDILNQNRSISREITDFYQEDVYTDVLQRYLMLTATYTLRRFGGQAQPRGMENSRP